MIKNNIDEKGMPLEREWVLPTHLKEKWSLRKFAEAFDAISEIPPDGDEDIGLDGHRRGSTKTPIAQANKRRGGKRVLLATVGEDSSIVYYIVHEGIVKPRQN